MGLVDGELLRDVPLKKIWDDDQYFVGFAGLHRLLRIPQNLNHELDVPWVGQNNQKGTRKIRLRDYVFDYIERRLLGASIAEGGLSYEEM